MATAAYDPPAQRSHFPLRVVANRVDEHIDRVRHSQQLSCPDGPYLAFYNKTQYFVHMLLNLSYVRKNKLIGSTFR